MAICVKVLRSNGVKTKRTSQYANEHGLPRPDSARFEHGGGSRSNTKGEYVVLVCQKHYLPTQLAHVFTDTVFEKLVCTACVFLVYAHVLVLYNIMYTHELTHA